MLGLAIADFGYCAAYRAIEDISGECEMLAKQTLLAELQEHEDVVQKLLEEQNKRREACKMRRERMVSDH